MEERYSAWITSHVTPETAYGGCAEITLAMQSAFPELHRVRGHYDDAIWGLRDHWWLETQDGEIVDPTAMQFPTKGSGEYIEWDDSRPEPTGKCPNCGGECYEHKSVCSEECWTDYRAYLMGGVSIANRIAENYDAD